MHVGRYACMRVSMYVRTYMRMCVICMCMCVCIIVKADDELWMLMMQIKPLFSSRSSSTSVSSLLTSLGCTDVCIGFEQIRWETIWRAKMRCELMRPRLHHIPRLTRCGHKEPERRTRRLLARDRNAEKQIRSSLKTAQVSWFTYTNLSFLYYSCTSASAREQESKRASERDS